MPTRSQASSADSREFTRHRFLFGDCCVAIEEHAVSSPAPTLFFLHGRFGHGETWLPVIERLLGQFRCINVDLPGYGGSFSSSHRGLSLTESAFLVHQLVQRFTPPGERAILVGHDTGGSIAQLSALHGRDRLAALVLINCAGIHEPPQGLQAGWFGWAARFNLFRLLKESRSLHPIIEEDLVAPWFTRSSRKARVRALRALRGSWPGPFERQFWRRELGKLRLPVLLLWGGRDRLNHPDIGRKLIGSLREADFFERSDAGHWPILEHPEWVAGRIQEFLFRVGGAAAAA